MSILQAAGGGGGNLQLNASDVLSAGTGYMPCGHPGSTGTPGLTVSGGSGTYSFLWSRSSGVPDHGEWLCSSTTAQNPTWRPSQQVCEAAGNVTEVWQVQAIDQLSGKTGSFSINVRITWASLL